MHFRVLVVGVEERREPAKVGDLLAVRAVQFVGEEVPGQAQPEVGFGGVWIGQAGKASEQSVLAEVASVAYISILHLEPPLRP